MDETDFSTLTREVLAVRARLSRTLIHRKMHEFGHGGLFVLEFLDRCGGKAYPKDFSVHLGVSTARIAALLARMEEKGWVARSPDKSDSRRTIVTLTDGGQRLLAEKRREIEGLLEEALHSLGADDTRALIRIEKRLLEIEGVEPDDQ